MTKLYDISRELMTTMAVWPGDQPFGDEKVAQIVNGDSVNVSRLTMSSHCGTHVDAPYHFTADGTRLEQVALTPYWGMAQVVSVAKNGPLTPADFAHVDLTLAPRILLHSVASEADPTIFPETYIYPTPALADLFGEKGIILYGTDAPSVDDMNSKTLPSHKALQKNGILILEGLNLTNVPDGVYELVAMPLKIVGGDGSPVRAVLRVQ